MNVADELLDPSIAPGMKTFVAQLRDALADIRFEIHRQFVDGDTVISQWTLRAVHRGELFGVPATGHPIAVRYVRRQLREWTVRRHERCRGLARRVPTDGAVDIVLNK